MMGGGRRSGRGTGPVGPRRECVGRCWIEERRRGGWRRAVAACRASASFRHPTAWSRCYSTEGHTACWRGLEDAVWPSRLRCWWELVAARQLGGVRAGARVARRVYNRLGEVQCSTLACNVCDMFCCNLSSAAFNKRQGAGFYMVGQLNRVRVARWGATAARAGRTARYSGGEQLPAEPTADQWHPPNLAD